MSTQLHMERASAGYVDRYRAYKVIVNGEPKAELRRGDVKKIDVDPGEIEVYLKIDWCSSRKIRIALKTGETVRVCCRPRSLATAFYGLTFGRHDYVHLQYSMQ